MSREKVLSGSLDDDPEDRQLRPKRMDEVVGQKDVMKRLMIAVEAAKRRGDSLGPAGQEGARQATRSDREERPEDRLPHATRKPVVNLRQRA